MMPTGRLRLGLSCRFDPREINNCVPSGLERARELAEPYASRQRLLRTTSFGAYLGNGTLAA